MNATLLQTKTTTTTEGYVDYFFKKLNRFYYFFIRMFSPSDCQDLEEQFSKAKTHLHYCSLCDLTNFV